MSIAPGSLGGRSDVVLPEDLPDVPRWRAVSKGYEPAEDVGDRDEFPERGTFVEVELLDGQYQGHDHLWLAVTEGLDELLRTAMDEEGEELDRLTVEVDTAEKAGSEERSPWRYTASIVPEDQLGPPE